ncbi:MAG: serine/threonine protein phosphatase [Rhizobiaceae bacterium]|nr:serine/threonine protein phosphatase [Rhizobiaceae bacterium]MCV0406120.1 serine/threonine protein phosphatase [Rhizobiaceae bacterium]
MRIYAVGDVHGRLDLLWALGRKIEDEIEHDRPADWRVVYLGDYVDRGADSAGVVDFLIEASGRDDRHIALRGNHDVAFLDFLAAPDKEGLFVNFGGRETAASYGVDLDTGSLAALGASHAALVSAVPAAHRAFIETLPYSTEIGDYFFCHAGIRPGVALADQSPDDLAWIRNDFLRHTKALPKVIVHGHTPVNQVEPKPNRINVDTGAYFSGRLSAVALEGTDLRVMTVEGDADWPG